MAPAKRRDVAPRDPGLDDIAVLEQWFKNAHEERLRDSPDQHLVEQERAKIEALATAIAARMRADYLARTRS